MGYPIYCFLVCWCLRACQVLEVVCHLFICVYLVLFNICVLSSVFYMPAVKLATVNTGCNDALLIVTKTLIFANSPYIRTTAFLC